jgi:hypothetical protein
MRGVHCRLNLDNMCWLSHTALFASTIGSRNSNPVHHSSAAVIQPLLQKRQNFADALMVSDLAVLAAMLGKAFSVKMPRRARVSLETELQTGREAARPARQLSRSDRAAV